LSLQIRALEEEFGVRFFERNRRKTTLTAAGLAFHDVPLQLSRAWTWRFDGQDWLPRGSWDCDLIFGMLRDAGIVPNVRQTAGQMPTLISLVDSGMGISILPASAVKNSVAAVVACEIADAIPMSEIAIAVNKGNRAVIVDNFRSFALESWES
jgi:DNA-binding transcriptional LysR family regulator